MTEMTYKIDKIDKTEHRIQSVSDQNRPEQTRTDPNRHENWEYTTQGYYKMRCLKR